MPFKMDFLYSDILIALMVLLCLASVIWARRYPQLCETWRKVFKKRLAMVSFIILTTYIVIACLDSIHFHSIETTGNNNTSLETKSLLDVILSPIGTHDEKTYSAPFASRLYSKETLYLPDGKILNEYPPLKYAGDTYANAGEKAIDIAKYILKGSAAGCCIWLVAAFPFLLQRLKKGKTDLPWITGLTSLFLILIIVCVSIELDRHYYILGTNKIGQDVFYLAIKSVRADLLIGVITMGVMLPFAVIFGMAAGYFRGIIDDIIQYIYTTLSSVPAVLLIAAAVLSLQLYMTNHPDAFQTIEQRADIRLLALCVILGVTEWTTLCRLLRGETLKLRELGYVQAAICLGVKSSTILSRHIFPNLMYIVLITLVIDFSGLVLAEAVLSYMGIGLDPTMQSWGNMINVARLEMAREPIVWWPLATAFTFMFFLVIAANLFADAVRDAFDPRNKS